MTLPVPALILHSAMTELGHIGRKGLRAFASVTMLVAIVGLLNRIAMVRDALPSSCNTITVPIVGLAACSFIAKWIDYSLSWMSTDTFEIEEALEKDNEAQLRPRFFFSTSMHLRLKPNQYFFNYPILYVGFSAKFAESIGSIFSIKESAEEKESSSRKAGRRPTWFTFFSVNPKDFMSARYGFEEKARRFLRLQDVDDSIYPHIYIVTAPSFIWWSFNPVTYYYIYDKNFELAHTILEVNNTFQESHAYLLPRKNFTADEQQSENYLYTHSFKKDFHISPFNRRTGAYKVGVLDPVREGRFDIKVSLLDDDGKRRMTVQTKSLGESLDILTATWVDVVRMVFMWALCGFLVVPRTFKECWRIFKSKNTEIYERPEPHHTSKARHPSKLEGRCQKLFLQFLQSRINNYTVPVKVNVVLPRTDVGVEPTVYELKPHATKAVSMDKSTRLDLDVEVTSHIFWSRALSNITFSELHESELAELQSEMRSIRVSNWNLLIDILDTHKRSDEPTETTARRSLFFGLRAFWHWRMFVFTPMVFQWLHGGALETSPIYLFYRLESPTLHFHPLQEPIPVQDFASYRTAMTGVTIQMLKDASYRQALKILKTLGCNLEWLPSQ
ncbi:hypothetical protein TWF696_006612 [Orbilia brochopaga]|uniref:Uncharacterized protein n=1 Tax=Orbilia brochopaga TaxID=3140254 RepID=A0AAV9UPB8_9PEZI